MQYSTPSSTRDMSVRDLELDSVAIGPSTRMIVLEADADGRVCFRFGRRRYHSVALPRQPFAGARLLLIDAVRWAMLLEPKTQRLVALIFFTGLDCRTVLFGIHWGQWINERGALLKAVSIPELLNQWNVPVDLHEARQTLGVEFHINIHERENFVPSALPALRPGPLDHLLELQFGYPLGGFRLARIKTEDPRTNATGCHAVLEGFPLRMPVPAAERKAPEPPPPPKPAPAEQPTARPYAWHHPAGPGTPGGPGLTGRYGQVRVQRDGDAPRPRAATSAPAATRPVAVGSRPLPHTENLAVPDMLTAIAAEHDPDRRWRMIEANLTLARPERTYALLARFTETIADRAAEWPPLRLKTIFGLQPGSVLIGMMHDWQVNQVLALADGNPEGEKIMEWLREREIERLLRLDLATEVISIEAARKALRVDRHADDTAIKKTWRTLLSFMNADHGRSEERAIHRKKDEVAKFLQVARNILLKGR